MEAQGVYLLLCIRCCQCLIFVTKMYCKYCAHWNSIELVKTLSLCLHILLCVIYCKRYDIFPIFSWNVEKIFVTNFSQNKSRIPHDIHIFSKTFWLPKILRYNMRIGSLLCQTWEYSYFSSFEIILKQYRIWMPNK